MEGEGKGEAEKSREKKREILKQSASRLNFDQSTGSFFSPSHDLLPI